MSMSKYYWHHRNNRWTKAAMYGMIRMVLHNSWIYFKNKTQSDISSLEFYQDLVQEITKKHSAPIVPTQPPAQVKHEFCTDLNLSRGNRCKGIRCLKQTTHYCNACDQYLCKNCFIKSHNNGENK